MIIGFTSNVFELDGGYRLIVESTIYGGHLVIVDRVKLVKIGQIIGDWPVYDRQAISTEVEKEE